MSPPSPAPALRQGQVNLDHFIRIVPGENGNKTVTALTDQGAEQVEI